LVEKTQKLKPYAVSASRIVSMMSFDKVCAQGVLDRGLTRQDIHK
jgi:hypothetical protein